MTVPKMNHLYMWLHRKSGHVENLSGNEETITPVSNFGSMTTTPVVGPGNYQDNGFFGTPTTFFITYPGGGGFPLQFAFTNFKIEITVPNTETDPYKVRMFSNFGDTPIFVSSSGSGSRTFTWNYGTTTGNPSDVNDILFYANALTFDIVANNVINISDFKVSCIILAVLYDRSSWNTIL